MVAPGPQRALHLALPVAGRPQLRGHDLRPRQRARRAGRQGAPEVPGDQGRHRRHHGDPGHGQDRPPVRGLARAQHRVRDLHDEEEDGLRVGAAAARRRRLQGAGPAPRRTSTPSSTTSPRAPTPSSSTSTRRCTTSTACARAWRRSTARRSRRANYDEWAPLGGSVVWSPFSNLWLYRGTTDVLAARAAGVRICLGADWSPSGSKNLLGELKVADMWNTTHAQRRADGAGDLRDGHLQPRRRDQLGRRIGRLKAGLHGDVLVTTDRVRRPLPATSSSRSSATCSSWRSTASRSTAPRSS